MCRQRSPRVGQHHIGHTRHQPARTCSRCRSRTSDTCHRTQRLGRRRTRRRPRSWWSCRARTRRCRCNPWQGPNDTPLNTCACALHRTRKACVPPGPLRIHPCPYKLQSGPRCSSEDRFACAFRRARTACRDDHQECNRMRRSDPTRSGHPRHTAWFRGNTPRQIHRNRGMCRRSKSALCCSHRPRNMTHPNARMCDMSLPGRQGRPCTALRPRNTDGPHHHSPQLRCPPHAHPVREHPDRAHPSRQRPHPHACRASGSACVPRHIRLWRSRRARSQQQGFAGSTWDAHHGAIDDDAIIRRVVAGRTAHPALRGVVERLRLPCRTRRGRWSSCADILPTEESSVVNDDLAGWRALPATVASVVCELPTRTRRRRGYADRHPVLRDDTYLAARTRAGLACIRRRRSTIAHGDRTRST